MPTVDDAAARARDDVIRDDAELDDAESDGAVRDGVVLDDAGVDALVRVLRADGYRVIGPAAVDGAITLVELTSAAGLPAGWAADTEAGYYRLRRRADSARFGHSAGPQSWKRYLHPPALHLWSADRDGSGLTIEPEPPDPARYALLGVRPCDLAAIGVLDRVLGADPAYRARRDGTFLVAVNCTEPSATCFCQSAGGGPRAGPGADLVLTEQLDAGQPWYRPGVDRRSLLLHI